MNGLTIKEAAEVLDVTPATLRNWDRSGKLKPFRDPQNGYRLYSVAEVQSLLKDRNPSRTGKVSVQAPLLEVAESREAVGDEKSLRRLVRKMSAAFRDSEGGGLLERFEEVSKLLYCKMYDERQAKSVKGYEPRFRSALSTNAETVHAAVSELYKEAAALLPEIATNGRGVLSDDKRAVAKVVELLQDVDLGKIPTDVKGSVYEELIRNTFEKNDNQQFFTPRNVVDFMVDFISPEAQQIVCDPACGSGGFLITTAERFADDQEPTLVGLEIDRRMAWVAQMNMIMHGAGRGTVHHLSGGGALALSPEVNALIADGSLDVIITNPPFGSDFDEDDLQKYRLGKGKNSRRRGVLFIERCVGWLRPGGRMAIIIDDSVLNGLSNEDARRFVLETCVIEAVVSLPDVTFMPYATAKASILFLRKRTSEDEPQTDIFMADVAQVGRKPNGDPLYLNERDRAGNLVLNSDLPHVAEIWKRYRRFGRDVLEAETPRIFLCPSKRFHEQSVDRIDVQFHHPSREVAEMTLSRSAYPTPKLIDLVVERNESVIPSIADPDEVWRYIGLANIEAGNGEYEIVTTSGSHLKSAVRRFKPGNILFSKLRPELRKCVLIPDGEDDGFVSSECFVFSVAGGPSTPQRGEFRGQYEVDKEYLAFMLRSDIVFGQLVYQVTGVGRPRVNKATVLNLRIPLPPLAAQREIMAAHTLSRGQYLDYKKRSETMLREGNEALQAAYDFAVEKLCPAATL